MCWTKLYILSTQLIFRCWGTRTSKSCLGPLKWDSTVRCPSISTLTRTSSGSTTERIYQTQTDTLSPTSLRAESGSLGNEILGQAESYIYSFQSPRCLIQVATPVPYGAPTSHRISSSHLRPVSLLYRHWYHFSHKRLIYFEYFTCRDRSTYTNRSSYSNGHSRNHLCCRRAGNWVPTPICSTWSVFKLQGSGMLCFPLCIRRVIGTAYCSRFIPFSVAVDPPQSKCLDIFTGSIRFIFLSQF